MTPDITLLMHTKIISMTQKYLFCSVISELTSDIIVVFVNGVSHPDAHIEHGAVVSDASLFTSFKPKRLYEKPPNEDNKVNISITDRTPAVKTDITLYLTLSPSFQVYYFLKKLIPAIPPTEPNMKPHINSRQLENVKNGVKFIIK